MITYSQHPQFEFDILVDLYANGTSCAPLVITKVERKLIGAECVATIRGYVEVDVPVEDVDEDRLLEVVREAHNRNITSVKTRCVFSVMLDGRAYQAVKSYSQMNMSRYFVVEMVGYTMNDEFVDSQRLVLENELHSYATYYITQFMNKSYSNRANLSIMRKGAR